MKTQWDGVEYVIAAPPVFHTSGSEVCVCVLSKLAARKEEFQGCWHRDAKIST